MTWTAPPQWVTGSGISANSLNTYLRDNLLSLRNNNDYYVGLSRAANLSLPTTGYTDIPWTVQSGLVGTGLHATASGTKLNAPVAGVYRLVGSVVLNSASGYAEVAQVLNGSTGAQYSLRTLFYGSANPRVLPFAEDVLMTTADYLNVRVFFNVGTSATLVGGTTGSRCTWRLAGAAT